MRLPAIAPPQHELADDAGLRGRAVGLLHLELEAGHGLSQRARLDDIVARAGIVDQHDADLRGAVHAACRNVKGLVDELQCRRIDGLAGIGQLLDGEREVPRLARVLHHPVVRGGGREIRDPVILQRLHEPHRIEATGEGTGRDAECQRSQRAMPESMSPRGRRRTEKLVARPDTRTVQRGKHQRHHGAMRVLDGRRQFPRRAGGILEYRHVLGARRGSIGGRQARDFIEQLGIGHDDPQALDLPGDRCLLRCS